MSVPLHRLFMFVPLCCNTRRNNDSVSSYYFSSPFLFISFPYFTVSYFLSTRYILLVSYHKTALSVCTVQYILFGVLFMFHLFYLNQIYILPCSQNAEQQLNKILILLFLAHTTPCFHYYPPTFCCLLFSSSLHIN